jgi:hypothetical protein
MNIFSDRSLPMSRRVEVLDPEGNVVDGAGEVADGHRVSVGMRFQDSVRLRDDQAHALHEPRAPFDHP